MNHKQPTSSNEPWQRPQASRLADSLPPTDEIMEKLLHYVWQHRLFPLGTLRPTEGQAVEVIQPGTHNFEAGPDFFNAQVRIDGEYYHVDLMRAVERGETELTLLTSAELRDEGYVWDETAHPATPEPEPTDGSTPTGPDAPTEPSTEPPTEPPTEAPTEPSTEPSGGTEETSGAGE